MPPNVYQVMRRAALRVRGWTEFELRRREDEARRYERARIVSYLREQFRQHFRPSMPPGFGCYGHIDMTDVSAIVDRIEKGVHLYV
jgi:hypothetical protein